MTADCMNVFMEMCFLGYFNKIVSRRKTNQKERNTQDFKRIAYFCTKS